MAHYHGRQSLLGNGYRSDLVSVIGMVVLRREDGTEVARFRVCDATSKVIEQAARQDQHVRSRAEAKNFT
jgi:hypothetical protein